MCQTRMQADTARLLSKKPQQPTARGRAHFSDAAVEMDRETWREINFKFQIAN